MNNLKDMQNSTGQYSTAVDAVALRMAGVLSADPPPAVSSTRRALTFEAEGCTVALDGESIAYDNGDGKKRYVACGYVVPREMYRLVAENERLRCLYSDLKVVVGRIVEASNDSERQQATYTASAVLDVLRAEDEHFAARDSL